MSDRLLLRPFEENDAVRCPWFRDPGVMRWIPGGPDADLSVTAERIAKYREHFKRHGFSKYVILERNSGVPIGDSGIMYLADTDMLELGYRIAPEFQGQGYATEAALAVLEEATVTGLHKVHAIANPLNSASLSILSRKVGFAYVRPFSLMSMQMALYCRKLIL